MSYQQQYLSAFTHNIIGGVRQWQCIYSEFTHWERLKSVVRFGRLSIITPVKVTNGFSLKPHQYLG